MSLEKLIEEAIANGIRQGFEDIKDLLGTEKPKATRTRKPKEEKSPEPVEDEPVEDEPVEDEPVEAEPVEEGLTYEQMMDQVKSLISGSEDGATKGRSDALAFIKKTYDVDKFKDIPEDKFEECVAGLTEALPQKVE